MKASVTYCVVEKDGLALYSRSVYVSVTKILVSDDPMQVLRTRTHGIGTETYRAPEVNSGKAYNPAAADVWGLGVMLFFFVSESQTYSRCVCVCVWVSVVKVSPNSVLYVVFGDFVLDLLLLCCSGWSGANGDQSAVP